MNDICPFKVNVYRFILPTGITTMIDGKNKTLYMSSVKSIEERTRSNLTLSMGELHLKDDQLLMVTDQTTPNTIMLQLKFNTNEVEMN